MDQPRPPFHLPVLAGEVTRLLAGAPSGTVLDATFGGGGHTRALLAARPDSQVLAVDRDPEAIAEAAGLGPAVTTAVGNFAQLAAIAREHGVDGLAGALFDLGVSSHQLDAARRGFGYRADGPLDMRMGPDASMAAADIVNTWPQADIAAILRRFGEERFAARVAAAIVAARPLAGTEELAGVVAGAIPAAARRRRHPARKTFQALRIAVNDELGAVASGLDSAIDLLVPGGRVVVISYHSLEDRIVKRRFAAGAQGCVCPPELPVCGCGRAAELTLLTRRPIRPEPAEVEANRRARSARLRAAEKVAA